MMSKQVSYDKLAATIVEQLGIYWAYAAERQFTVETVWYTRNWVRVKGSLPGYHSSPYPSQVSFDPSAQETIELAQDFLHFLAQESGVATPDLDDDAPLLRLIAQVVSNDNAGDCFLDILGDQTEGEDFNLGDTLSALQTKELLPGAEAWKLEEIKKYKLDELLEKLAKKLADKTPQGGQFRFDVKAKLRENRWQHVIHDHRHYLLFGQTPDHIAPKSWLGAAWKFIQHFRCNFGMYITEAMLYDKVTIVGADDIPVPVSRKDQQFLEKYTGEIVQEDGTKKQWRQVERLNVINADQLAALLQDRIDRGVCFEGPGEIWPPE
jgi:hypothetical protein